MFRMSVIASPAADLDRMAEPLLAGGVALLPTDTIYGLHVLADDENAVGKVVALKGRDADKPFVVLGASVDQLQRLGVIVKPDVRAIVDELWPGPLTAILPLERAVAASRGSDSLAVRVPDVAWLRHLLERTGPLLSTSANRSGEMPTVTPDGLAHDLHPQLDIIVDGGVLDAKPSMIVDFTGAPRVLRDGEFFFTQKVWKRLRKSL
jgi:L-threonylcarbamoyladenylate synthase